MRRLQTILLLCIANICLSQPYRFRHLTTADGLLSNQKLLMAEDPEGRIWIGSDEGLNVFDGHLVSTFNQPDNVFDGNHNILQIYSDKKGTIWVATPLGVFFKKHHDNRFGRLKYTQALEADGVFFGETLAGNLLVANRNSCYEVSTDGQAKRLSGFDGLFRDNKILLSFQHFKGHQWLMAFRNKMYLVNIKRQQPIKAINLSSVWCAAPIDDSSLLAGSFAHDTLWRANAYTGKVEIINNWKSSKGKTISGYAGSIIPVGKNIFAIGTRYSGIFLLDVDKRYAIPIKHNPADPTSIKWDGCRRLMFSRSGTLFALTIGLSFTQLSAPAFPSQSFLANEKDERYNGAFTTILHDKKGQFWVGTNRYLALWNRETNISKFYSFIDAKLGPQKYKTIRSVVTDSQDRVWVGTYGGGIGKLLSNGTFYQIKRNPIDIDHSLPSNDINAITKTTDQNFFICANNGFALFNPITAAVTRYLNHPTLSKIADKTTFYILEDNAKNWWVAQAGGLFFYNKIKNEVYTVALPNNQSQSGAQVIATDSSGNIYAGTPDGLYVISALDCKVKKVFRKSDGLTSNNIVGLLCDKQGKMWILGNIGISRYDPVTQLIESFDARDGILLGNHTLCNFFMAKDGEVFFTGTDGLNFFYPHNLSYSKRPLSVWLSAIELSDTTITIPQENNYWLSHNKNNISLSFLAVDLQYGPSIKYRYQLEGYDKGYVYAGTERTARYANLPAGKYVFKAEASLNGFDWFALKENLSLSVAKAFWKTWWFVSGILILLGILVLIITSTRIKKIKKEEALKRDFENQLAQLRMSLLRTQMNPHFLFNSLNSINSFILKNDRQNASGYLTKFSRLMRLILDNSRSEWVTLESELKAIELYIQLEALRFNHSFSHHIHISGSMDTEDIIIPPMLIQPYIENAIWHGLMYRKEPGGSLIVNVSEEDDWIKVVVTDNGVGRSASEALKSKSALQQKSYGMKITSERMRVVNVAYQIHAHAEIADVVEADGLVVGTTVTLTLKKINQKEKL
ncbi:MAG: hypothetical protein EAY75_09230 [Bacteroidetes bacterium]|nr:MAG: hypothetical protein EAY75_09230 [Bacteroidota bacterium]